MKEIWIKVSFEVNGIHAGRNEKTAASDTISIIKKEFYALAQSIRALIVKVED